MRSEMFYKSSYGLVSFEVVTSVFLEQCSLCKKEEEINFYIAFNNIIERMRHLKKW
jgi:hypothetical protein